MSTRAPQLRHLAFFDAVLAQSLVELRGDKSRNVMIGVLHENGRQIYAYGAGSWVHEILGRLGLNNALGVPPSRFGNALIDLAQLAESSDVRLFYLDQGDRTRRAEQALSRSTLWRGLPIVREGRVHPIPVFYPLGGIPSATRFVQVLTAALLQFSGRKA